MFLESSFVRLNTSHGFVECFYVAVYFVCCVCVCVCLFQNGCENCVKVDSRVKSHFSYLFMKWSIVRKASCLQLINYGSTIITSC